MGFYEYVILSFTIFIAGVIGIIRFQHIHKAYHPLLYFFWLASINEFVNFLLLLKRSDSLINNNIYVIVEAVLITWYFNRVGLFKRKPAFFYCLLTAFSVAWILENLLLGSLQTTSFYFRIFYSFVIVLMSIHCINDIITTSRGYLLKNASFLVCIGFILYFTYKVLVEAFGVYGLSTSVHFQVIVYTILIYINVIVNFIYALAALWMPKRQAFTLPS